MKQIIEDVEEYISMGKQENLAFLDNLYNLLLEKETNKKLIIMKTISILLFSIFGFFVISCANKKNIKNDQLYNKTWELEYISGPRIAFVGLYPDRKPKITFYKSTKKVIGNNSCNGYAASYIVKDDAISFGEPGATTMMFCGEGEKVFLNTIKKINKFSVDKDGKLNLMINDVPMMRFKKAEN